MLLKIPNVCIYRYFYYTIYALKFLPDNILDMERYITGNDVIIYES